MRSAGAFRCLLAGMAVAELPVPFLVFVPGATRVCEPGVFIIGIGPYRLRFTYATPVLGMKLRMDTPRAYRLRFTYVTPVVGTKLRMETPRAGAGLVLVSLQVRESPPPPLTTSAPYGCGWR
jgi:hypothetical protein